MISYETSPAASALQWLSKNQTAGKRHPYLLSQSQVGIYNIDYERVMIVLTEAVIWCHMVGSGLQVVLLF